MPPTIVEKVNNLIYAIAINHCETSYKKLFGLLFHSLFRFSYCILKSREQAEEVASDVMLKLWQRRVELLGVENVQVYALIMARNHSLNILKKNTRAKIISLEDIDVEVNLGTLNPEQILINSQDRRKLESYVQALPAKCKMVFQLVKEEGLSYKEVGEVLDISPKTVDAHLVSAMKKLTEALRVKLDRA
jgi:RNA polymerase sigma-70 factor (ECF subfamily)